MTFHKTSLGNYRCWYRGYYVAIWKKPHGAWAAILSCRGIPIEFNGLFGTSMPTLKHVKKWILTGNV